MITNVYNPRYTAYARAKGRESAEQLAHDRERWPGGRMTGFMLWIRERWHAWSQETGEKPDGGWRPNQHKLFNAWLQEGYGSTAQHCHYCEESLKDCDCMFLTGTKVKVIRWRRWCGISSPVRSLPTEISA